MELSKDEIIKKLAQALLDTMLVCNDGTGKCFICEEKNDTHKQDCPILLAKEVLKERITCPKCYGEKLVVEQVGQCTFVFNDCSVCNGTGILDCYQIDEDDTCNSCYGTGVEK